MKTIWTKIILVLMFSIYLTSMDVVATNAKRDLQVARREYSKISNQKNKISKQTSIWQKEYDAAAKQMIENENKPKSLPYKNAAKKCETLSTKIEENKIKVRLLEKKMDSLNLVIANFEVILRSEIQEKEMGDSDLIKPQENINEYSEQEYQMSEATNEVSNVSTDDDSSSKQDTENTSNDDGGIYGILIYLGIIILFIIISWAEIKYRFRCPKCGKWFTYESQGDRRVVDYDERGRIVRRGARKRHVCSNCGYERTFIEWFKK